MSQRNTIMSQFGTQTDFYLKLQKKHYPNYIPQNVYCSVGRHPDSSFDTDKDPREHHLFHYDFISIPTLHSLS